MPLTLLLAIALVFPQAAVLYDGALGTTPDQQGMALLRNPPFGASSTQTFADGATTLDSTTVRGESAGYFGGAGVPALDRTAGFRLEFDAQLVAEQHDGSDRNGDAIDDRAGFSVTVLSSDKLGIELGFWQGRVWAQADGAALFTQAEGAALDTSLARSYELRVQGDSYTLRADGALLLSGPLRDYTTFSGVFDPYETPNFVFLGDNTSSASARVRIARVAVRVGDYATALPLVGGQ